MATTCVGNEITVAEHGVRFETMDYLLDASGQNGYQPKTATTKPPTKRKKAGNHLKNHDKWQQHVLEMILASGKTAMDQKQQQQNLSGTIEVHVKWFRDAISKLVSGCFRIQFHNCRQEKMAAKKMAAKKMAAKKMAAKKDGCKMLPKKKCCKKKLRRKTTMICYDQWLLNQKI